MIRERKEEKIGMRTTTKIIFIACIVIGIILSATTASVLLTKSGTMDILGRTVKETPWILILSSSLPMGFIGLVFFKLARLVWKDSKKN